MKYIIVEEKKFSSFAEFLNSDKDYFETFAKLMKENADTIRKWINDGDLYEYTESDVEEIQRILDELYEETINLVDYDERSETIKVLRIKPEQTPVKKRFPICPHCKKHITHLINEQEVIVGWKFYPDGTYSSSEILTTTDNLNVWTCPHCGNVLAETEEDALKILNL